MQSLRACFLTAVLLLLSSRVTAQLRPLERFDWDAFLDNRTIHVQARAGWLTEQHASLAGTVGDLVELGELRVSLRAGAAVLEFAGTPQRWFHDDRVFAEPAGGARPAGLNGKRHDAGDYRVGTALRLTGAASPWLAILRFGTRLPTTDNRVGLDRDQTDFFALAGLHRGRTGWRFSTELGVGIHGTRSATYEQNDVLLYMVALEYAARNVRPFVALIGHDDLADRRVRGNEDLSELRAGLRIGRSRWVDITAVRGLRTFSPRAGILVGGGMSLDGWWR